MEIFVIAGPNGAGKSTAAQAIVPAGATFINADDIAHIEGFSEITAGRLFLRRIEQLAEKRADIAIETTLASRTLAKRIRGLKGLGYTFRLAYVWVNDPELSVARVRERTLSGGHTVPEETIRRRYTVSLRNLFEVYMPLADRWRIYDNSLPRQPQRVAEGSAGTAPVVYNEDAWNGIRRAWRDG